jgi:hypothetical protein
VKGAARADIAYTYYAILLAESSDCLTLKGGRKDALNDLSQPLDSPLSKIRNALPAQVYDLIAQDVNSLNHGHDVVRLDDKRTESETHLDEDPKSVKMVHQWGDLVIGTVSVSELLNKKGKACLYFFVAVAGIAMFGGMTGVVGLIIYYGSIWLHVDIFNLSASTGYDFLASLVSLLSLGGLSIPLLASKAWSALKIMEPGIAVGLLKRMSLRH